MSSLLSLREMPSALGTSFNKAPTFANFQALTAGNPKEARAVIQRLAESLSDSGAPVEQRKQLDVLLEAQEAQLSGLTASSPVLKALFPDAPAAASFAEIVARATKVDSLKWAANVAPPQIAVTGALTRTTLGQLVLTTESGRSFRLVPSLRGNGTGLPLAWIEGFLNEGEGPVTVRGTVTPDGKTFRVETYAPGSSPDYLFGRVDVRLPNGPFRGQLTPDQAEQLMGPNGHVFINTPRGQIEVMDPALKKMLANVGAMGLILPGTIERDENGRLTTHASADFFYALGGRFEGVTDKGSGVFETKTAFAQHTFQGPVVASGESARWRMANSNKERNWLGGTFKFDDPVPHFEARYISRALSAVPEPPDDIQEASANAQLLVGSEVVDAANDFVRVMGPPGA